MTTTTENASPNSAPVPIIDAVPVVPEGLNAEATTTTKKKRRLEIENGNGAASSFGNGHTASSGMTAATTTPTNKLLIKRLSEKARLPTRGSAFAAGYDLYSAEKKVIPAKSKALIDTQISIAVPVGCYGRVAPRSGLASKFMIDTGAGVIDADYRGVVYVLLFNFSDSDFEVSEGDRIAQLIIEKIETPDVVEVNDLEATLRGAGGFGSTGGHGSL